MFVGYLFNNCIIIYAVNNVAAHGIPDQRPLQEGDIVNVDITVFKVSCKLGPMLYEKWNKYR